MQGFDNIPHPPILCQVFFCVGHCFFVFTMVRPQALGGLGVANRVVVTPTLLVQPLSPPADGAASASSTRRGCTAASEPDRWLDHVPEQKGGRHRTTRARSRPSRCSVRGAGRLACRWGLSPAIPRRQASHPSPRKTSIRNGLHIEIPDQCNGIGHGRVPRVDAAIPPTVLRCSLSPYPARILLHPLRATLFMILAIQGIRAALSRLTRRSGHAGAPSSSPPASGGPVQPAGPPGETN